jgi:hypothetical protein
MDVRRLWRGFVEIDPALAWIREQDARRAKGALARVAILMLLLVPLLATKPTKYDALRPTAPEFEPAGLIIGVIAFGAATLLALNIDRPLMKRWQTIELAAWLLLVAMVSAGFHQWAIGKVGAPQMLRAGIVDFEALERYFAANPLEAASLLG